MASFFGLQLSPIFVPVKRRLQTLAVIIHTGLFLLAPGLCLLIFLIFLFSPLFLVALGYAAWVVYDVQFRRTPKRGGRRWEALRNSIVWRYYRDYFPITLVKTADLEPNRNYLFGYHPHGIIGCGAFCNFASEATNFSGEFPGIKPHLLTLEPNFKWPLLRAFLLWMGVCDVSKESINWILSRQGTGNAAIIVVGGAAEALEAKPGNYKLTLKERRGFVKMAVRNGASLVPVFSFGENDLFLQADNPEGSWLRTFQERFKNVFGFSPPLFHGRGVFNYTFGLLPFRTPIRTVVGRPIHVVKTDDPSHEQIAEVHEQYINDLSRLFDDHKMEYGIDESVKLLFV